MKIKNVKLILFMLTVITLQTGCINKNKNSIDNSKITSNAEYKQIINTETQPIKHTKTTSLTTSTENLLLSANSHTSKYTIDTSTISTKLTKCTPLYNTEISTEIINPDIFTASTKTTSSNVDISKITSINTYNNTTQTETLTTPAPTPATETLITESEKILLCNLVGREYGSDYHGNTGIPITLYERGKVVAVVMNRVNNSDFPNNIYDVIAQPNQFSGYLPSNVYSYQVTQNVIDSVDYYFEHINEYPSGILYFEGDGSYNYFY